MDEAPILEVIFLTLIENSSVVTNDTQGPQSTHTTENSCRDALPCTNMALKLPRYFYLLMEKPLGRYFQARSPYYQTAKCNQKTPIPKFIISADIGAQIWFYIQDFQGSKLLNSCLGLVVRPNVFH